MFRTIARLMSNLAGTRTRRQRRPTRRHEGETLEPRRLLRGVAWNDTSQLSLSFAPDGTDVGGEPSALFAKFNDVASTGEWKEAILRAFQTWAQHTTVNIGVVADQGQPLGVPGPRIQDPRFGDIRIAARPLYGDVMALGVSQNAIVAGTWAGDVVFNSEATFNSLDDVFAIALHEAGHVFGLSHRVDPQSPMHVHGLPTSVSLTDADIEEVIQRHGQRMPDRHEGERGNDSLRTATVLNLPEIDMLSVLAPILAYGDITTTDDVDYFVLPAHREFSGPVTVRLQSSGVSLLAPSLRVLNRRGVEVGRSESTRSGGATLLVRLDEVDINDRYTIVVSSSRADEFAVGEYSLIVSFDSLPQVADATVDNVATGRNRELDESQLRRLIEDQNALLNLDLHQNDLQAGASELSVRRGFEADLHFSTVASVSDDRDVDYYRFVAPDWAGDSRPIVNLTVRSLQAAGLIPRATVFNSRREELDAEILVNGNGEFVLQAALEPRQHYFVRVEADDAHGPFKVGNYRLSLSIVDEWIEMEAFMAGTVGGERQSTAQVLFVARPQLFHVALDTDRRPARDALGQVVVAHFVDSHGETLSRLSAPLEDTRTSHGLFMMPGEYLVQVFTTRVEDRKTAPIEFRLRGTSFSDPFGIDPDDPTEDPIFRCPGEDPIYCYPGGIISDEPFLWDDFLDSLPEVPDLEIEELIAAFIGDWWQWYWNYVGENGPVLAMHDAYQVDVDWPLIVGETEGVLSNDLDPEGDPMAAFLVQDANDGSVTLNSDGSFTYIPHAGFFGTDEFTYVASDFGENSSPATVVIEVVDEGRLPGDFNNDESVDGDDLALLCLAIKSAQHEIVFDLTDDNLVDQDDLYFLIQDLMQTSIGDATLDGAFDSSDLVAVFQAGRYELGVPGATWSTGDWNCDGHFDSSDLVLSFQHGGYAAGAASAKGSLGNRFSRPPDPEQMDDDQQSRKPRRFLRTEAFVA